MKRKAVNYKEPNSFEVILTVVIGNLLGSVYKGYTDRLGLEGDECVLDFGSGAGTPARYIAQKLLSRNGSLTYVDVSHVWMRVAQKRLRKYSNIEFKLGDIAILDIPNVSYDIVFIHFVLHDIDPAERSSIARNLVPKLKDNGKLFIREPLRFISQDEIRKLMRQNGLEEVKSQVTEIKTQGAVYEGAFRKRKKFSEQKGVVSHDPIQEVKCTPELLICYRIWSGGVFNEGFNSIRLSLWKY